MLNLKSATWEKFPLVPVFLRERVPRRRYVDVRAKLTFVYIFPFFLNKLSLKLIFYWQGHKDCASVGTKNLGNTEV